TIRHATGKWIFWLDADDRLDEDNRGKLRALLANLTDETVAYSMRCLCVPDPVTGLGSTVDHVRLFPNHPQLRWTYRVHEQILPAVRALGWQIRYADVLIQHTGYLDASLRRQKQERDLRLLRLEDAEHPNDPFTLFNLSMISHNLGEDRNALTYCDRSLS